MNEESSDSPIKYLTYEYNIAGTKNSGISVFSKIIVSLLDILFNLLNASA